MFAFNEPWWFLLLLLLIPMAYHHRRGLKVAVPTSSQLLFQNLPRSRTRFLVHGGFLLRALGITLAVLAMARPQYGKGEVKKISDGLDIMMVVDTSGSMRARDFVIGGDRPTRLEVVKRVMADFIKAREADRIGLVVFGTEAFTQAPLTMDHDSLQMFLSRIRISMAGDSTAIGDGIATAVKRLKDIEAKSKVVILLTDGTNTAGRVDPLAATAAAKTLGVKIYTIGVGSQGKVPINIGGRMRRVRMAIDEPLLKKIAGDTGGQYFRATATEALVKIYDNIDKLETREVELEEFRDFEERFSLFLWPALLFFFAEWLFGLTPWRKVP